MTEPVVTINCITDHTRGDRDLPKAFEQSINALEDVLAPILASFEPKGDLEATKEQTRGLLARIVDDLTATGY